MDARQAVDGVADQAQAAAREAAPWIERSARIGYAAHGIVYLILGVIAGQAALGKRSATGQRGAFLEILEKPGGRLMLSGLAVGLLAYAIWRFVESALDPENDGAGKRGVYALSGIIHVGLALTALRLASGTADGSGDNATSWTGRALDAPGGKWLVVLAAIGIAAFGIQQIIKGYKSELDRRLDLSRLSPAARRWAVRAARAGLAARGVIFAIVGLFLLRAGLRQNPGESRDVGGALQAVQGAAYGPWLLGVVALGLIGYGISELLKARYRRIRPA